MPYAVMIRPTETVEFEAPEADTLEEMVASLEAKIPDGFELVAIHPSKGTGRARRVELREITIENRADLASAVPEGWQALNIRQV
ncbi:MAG TPA: hypothetical protein VK015_03475 [Microbacterium sp.]|nr:hypothetical protein [Microbacterium sp.]